MHARVWGIHIQALNICSQHSTHALLRTHALSHATLCTYLLLGIVNFKRAMNLYSCYARHESLHVVPHMHLHSSLKAELSLVLILILILKLIHTLACLAND